MAGKLAYRDPFRQRGIFERVWDAITNRGAVRADSWMNLTTGAGDPARDKMMQGFMAPLRRLDYGEIESLYYGDDVCERIVDELPDEAFRRGYELEGSFAKPVLEQFKGLSVNAKLRDNFGWSRMWGGSAMILGVDDGQTPDKPLNIEQVKALRFINVVDRRYLNPVSYYEEPLSPQHGLPMTYQVTSPYGPSQIGQLIHESRMIRFWGTRIDPITSRRESGWSYSILQRPYDVIRMFASGFQAAGQLMYDAGQGVFKISNLITQLAGPNKDAILQRLANVDMQRWAGRMLVVDKDGEDFDRKPVSIAGVSDLLDHFEMRMAAAARMPVTLLMGRSPAGENATGESDMRNWYASVKAKQCDVLEPAIVRLANVITQGKFEKDGKVSWIGLEEPDDAAEAEVEKIEADTFKIYYDMGSLSGEQVALIKFGKKPIEEVIDVDALEAVVEADYAMAKNPPPAPALPSAPQGGSLNGSDRGPKPPAGSPPSPQSSPGY